jgi:hypothetical protein
LRRLDADLADEFDPVEIFPTASLTRLSCGVALVVRPDAPRRFQDRSQQRTANLLCRCVAWRSAFEGEPHPELPPLGVAVDHGKLAVQRFRISCLRAAQAATLAGPAWPDLHLQRRDRAGRDNVETALFFGIVEILKVHNSLLSTLL